MLTHLWLKRLQAGSLHQHISPDDNNEAPPTAAAQLNNNNHHIRMKKTSIKFGSVQYHVTHTCLITVPRFFISSVVHCYLRPQPCMRVLIYKKLLLAAGCVLVSMWASHNELHNATMANNDNNKTNLLFSVFRSRNRSSWRRIPLPVICFGQKHLQ